MERKDIAQALKQYASSLPGITLTDQQADQFLMYLEQLKAWNRSTNLTSITDEQEIVIKHFIDSLVGLVAENFVPGARILDVGTGAGFPGLPLKIVRPDLVLTLLEPSQKKSSFLHLMVGILKLKNVKIISQTIEQYVMKAAQEKFDYVVTRALRYDIVLKKAQQLLAPDGKILVYLSRSLDKDELTNESSRWIVVREFPFNLPKQGGGRVVSVLAPT